jgi:hypothetical protein
MLTLRDNALLDLPIHFDDCERHIVPELRVSFQGIGDLLKAFERIFKFVNCVAVIIQRNAHVKEDFDWVLRCGVANVFVRSLRALRLRKWLAPRQTCWLLLGWLVVLNVRGRRLANFQELQSFREVKARHFEFAHSQVQNSQVVKVELRVHLLAFRVEKVWLRLLLLLVVARAMGPNHIP